MYALARVDYDPFSNMVVVDEIFVFNTIEQAHSYRDWIIEHSEEDDDELTMFASDFALIKVSPPDPEWQDFGGES